MEILKTINIYIFFLMGNTVVENVKEYKYTELQKKRENVKILKNPLLNKIRTNRLS